MSILITERAADEVKRTMVEGKYGEETVLRVGVSAGGCSGLQYSLKFDKEIDDKMDKQFEVHGVKVVVDHKSYLYLDGVTLDYYNGLDRRGFTFDNPNVTKSCGCGSSFQA